MVDVKNPRIRSDGDVSDGEIAIIIDRRSKHNRGAWRVARRSDHVTCIIERASITDVPKWLRRINSSISLKIPGCTSEVVNGCRVPRSVVIKVEKSCLIDSARIIEGTEKTWGQKVDQWTDIVETEPFARLIIELPILPPVQLKPSLRFNAKAPSSRPNVSKSPFKKNLCSVISRSSVT